MRVWRLKPRLVDFHWEMCTVNLSVLIIFRSGVVSCFLSYCKAKKDFERFACLNLDFLICSVGVDIINGTNQTPKDSRS